MLTRDEYLKVAKDELGEKEFKNLYTSIDNDYYSLVEAESKQGKLISRNVYDSLTDGQRYHFNKHHNHRNDKIQD